MSTSSLLDSHRAVEDFEYPVSGCVYFFPWSALLKRDGITSEYLQRQKAELRLRS